MSKDPGDPYAEDAPQGRLAGARGRRLLSSPHARSILPPRTRQLAPRQCRPQPPVEGGRLPPNSCTLEWIFLCAQKTFQLPVTSLPVHKRGGWQGSLSGAAYCWGVARLQTGSRSGPPHGGCNGNSQGRLRPGQGSRRGIINLIRECKESQNQDVGASGTLESFSLLSQEPPKPGSMESSLKETPRSPSFHNCCWKKILELCRFKICSPIFLNLWMNFIISLTYNSNSKNCRIFTVIA